MENKHLKTKNLVYYLFGVNDFVSLWRLFLATISIKYFLPSRRSQNMLQEKMKYLKILENIKKENKNE